MSEKISTEKKKKVVEVENVNNKEKNMLHKGYVNKYHLIYSLSILTMIIILLISFIFKSSENAGAMLGFAATLSSILLAIIAITITLIDVAGQRSNVLDVKNSVEELKNVSNDITVIVEEFEVRNKLRDEEIFAFISQINKYNETNSKKFDDITNKLDQISTTGEAKVEVEKIKQDIAKMKNNIEFPQYVNPDSIEIGGFLESYNKFKKNNSNYSILENSYLDYQKNKRNRKEK